MKVDVFDITMTITDGSHSTFAVLSLELDFLSMRGFRIMQSNYEHKKSGLYLRLVPPKFLNNKHVAVFFKDEKDWKALEDRVIERYLELKKEKD